jgi:dTDP-4-dehydrorhamnose 3,5-epimerase
MIFTETPLPGAFVIEPEPVRDSRGFFARVFCRKVFTDRGLVGDFVQVNNSLAVHRGTLRGLHYQLPPSAEVKLVRCVRGSLHDVILDLREDSPSFGKHFAVELSAENRRMLYVPKGFAHGFITLEDDTEALYFVDAFYDPARERGIRFDDPRFGIRWPLEPVVISDKDRGQRDFDPAHDLGDARDGWQ